ncbi:hypothetical protein [Coraliomargarita parva]|uniref:hypothetical protein n=1 Tax=Coraliomargarita parva TaxID=3014050 RepID=UPI0022B3CA83|nr:hypothetical protein [Coraliomargarita parva]
MKQFLCLTSLLLLGFHLGLANEEIHLDGILGNSGMDGESLVRYDGVGFDEVTAIHGLAYDRFGVLWSFGGDHNLMRLSLDGRMLGTYPAKVTRNESRSLVLVGDWLLLRLGNKLSRLPISAESGLSPESLDLKVLEIALNSVDGLAGVVTEDRRIGVYEPLSGTFTEYARLEEGDRVLNLAVLSDRSLVLNGAVRFTGESERSLLPNRLPGDFQIAGGYAFAFQWHMTVQRWNLDFEPSPGVIYGGSSGYFIGSLPEDGEMHYPRGIAHLGGNRFALVGPVGVIHLVEYDPKAQAFHLVRRLGGLHFPSTLVLDERGRTWYYSGFWDWPDSPVSPLKGETAFASRDWDQVQGSTSLNGQVLLPFLFRGSPRLMHRSYDEKSKSTSSEVKELPKNPTGFALRPDNDGKRQIGVVVNAAGEGVQLQLAGNGAVQKVLGQFKLELEKQHPSITSLAFAPDGQLMAASGRGIVLLAAHGNTYKEVGRMQAYQGPNGETPFGDLIYLDIAEDLLWVCDTSHNRIVLFRLEGHVPAYLDAFDGAAVLKTPLEQPQRIDAAGSRAVVIDWGNQRIVKLSTSSQ